MFIEFWLIDVVGRICPDLINCKFLLFQQISMQRLTGATSPIGGGTEWVVIELARN